MVIELNFVLKMNDRKIEPEKSYIKNETRYRHWFEDDLTGDFIATPEGILLKCNPAFIDIYGFLDIESAEGFDISKFNPSDWKLILSNIQNKGDVKEYPSWHLRQDNTKIHVILTIIGVFNDEGELIQVKGYVFDDTERKIAEESLKESEKKYRLLFDEDLTGDFIATPEGKILECNPAFAEIYGFNDCQSALEWDVSKSNPFDWPFLVTRLKKECKILGYQSWQRRYDGLRIHVIANLMGIFNDSKELIRVKGYVFDDTERKRTEQELVQNHRQIMEILNSIQDGFVALNHYWQFIYVNKYAAEYVDLEVEDIIGQNIWERFPELIGTKFEEVLNQVMDDEKSLYFDVKGVYSKDRWFKVSVYPSPDGISILWRNITKKES